MFLSVPKKMINYMVIQWRREHSSLHTLALVLRGAASEMLSHYHLAEPLPSLCPSWDYDLVKHSMSQRVISEQKSKI